MIKKDKFDAVWLLIQSGATDDLIMSTMGIEATTLDRIKKSNGDFEQYKKIHAAHLKNICPNEKQTPSKESSVSSEVIHQHNITVQANHYMMEELQNQTKLLALISNKLAAIMEELGVMNK